MRAECDNILLFEFNADGCLLHILIIEMRCVAHIGVCMGFRLFFFNAMQHAL